MTKHIICACLMTLGVMYYEHCYAEQLTCYSFGKQIFDESVTDVKAGEGFLIATSSVTHDNVAVFGECVVRGFKIPQPVKKVHHAIKKP